MSGIDEFMATPTAPRLSPVHQLIPEILAEIFINTISIPGIDESPRNRQTYLAVPYSLSQACQFWRSVAINIPAMWSIQPAIGLHTFKHRTKGFDTLFDSHIRRSRDIPIHVALSSDTYYLPKDTDPDYVAVMTVIGQSHRWKSLIVESMKSSRLFWMLSTIGQLPSLTALTLHDRMSINQPFNAPSGLSIFKNSPLLHHVIINGIESTLPPRTYIGLPRSMDHLVPIKTQLELCTFRGPLCRMSQPTSNIIFPALLSVLRVDNRNIYYRPRHDFPPLDDMITPGTRNSRLCFTPATRSC